MKTINTKDLVQFNPKMEMVFKCSSPSLDEDDELKGGEFKVYKKITI